MSTSPESQRKKEQPSTYVVQDLSSTQELARVKLQDQMITESMGGVLPEQSDPTRFESVLDIGCGPGGWLIEVAKAYPSIKKLVGIDISELMIEDARATAKEQQVSDRVTFEVADAMRGLPFATDTFGLVNMRLGFSYLRTWDWANVLREFQRVAQPGGVIRVSEAEVTAKSSSPVLTQLFDMLTVVMYRAGYLFEQESNGLTKQLVSLLQQSGIQNVQSRDYLLSYRAGTPQWTLFIEDMERIFAGAQPLLRKWVQLPENYDALRQQALDELDQPGAWGTISVLSAWGNKAPKETQ